MIGIFRQLQWVILQYDYNVNTTVLKLLYPTNSKAQHYKANGHLSIDLFLMKNKNKINTHTYTHTQKETATLCIGSKPHVCTVSKSGDYPEADYDGVWQTSKLSSADIAWSFFGQKSWDFLVSCGVRATNRLLHIDLSFYDTFVSLNHILTWC